VRRLGAALLGLIVATALLAPALAPHDPAAQFRGLLFAPPMRLRVVDAEGRWRAPFVYPWRLASRLEQRYEPDTTRPVPVRWLAGGKLLVSSDEEAAPLLLLGADSFGRDILARLLYGARTSLGLALAATLGALAIGLIVGGLSGLLGGMVDEALMRTAEFVLVLPAIYVILALRAALPLVLPASTIFAMMAGILALVGWPYVARGVRGIVLAESRREYAMAAVSLGASRTRLLVRHLLPASFGFVAVQATLLVPAFILAEATLSFVGLGFPDEVPSWGSMLREASDIVTITQFPWALAPAAGIFAVVLGVNLIVQGRTDARPGAGPLDAPSSQGSFGVSASSG
jgi:peptide/nickel transport system permease protein